MFNNTDDADHEDQHTIYVGSSRPAAPPRVCGQLLTEDSPPPCASVLFQDAE